MPKVNPDSKDPPVWPGPWPVEEPYNDDFYPYEPWPGENGHWPEDLPEDLYPEITGEEEPVADDPGCGSCGGNGRRAGPRPDAPIEPAYPTPVDVAEPPYAAEPPVVEAPHPPVWPPGEVRWPVPPPYGYPQPPDATWCEPGVGCTVCEAEAGCHFVPAQRAVLEPDPAIPEPPPSPWAGMPARWAYGFRD